MALTRVQASPQGQTVLNATVTFTFAAPPTVGNAVIVLLSAIGSSTVPATGQVTDNRGNVYELVQERAQGNQHATIFACLATTATGTPFIVTAALNGTNVSITGRAIEVGGFTGGALWVDRVVGNGATSAAPTSGVTAALRTTAAEAFAVGVLTTPTGVAQAAITVESVSPAWTQEHERLSGTNATYGESDSRILTSPNGTTQSISWTITTSGAYAASLAVFVSVGTVALDTRVTQDAVETLSYPVPAARVTQDVVELLASVEGVLHTESRVTHAVVETLQTSPPPFDVRVTQDAVETLQTSPPPIGARVTQLALDVFYPRMGPARTTQGAVEVMYPVVVTGRTTQGAVEVFLPGQPALGRATQLVVEVFLTVPPCVLGAFPVDTVAASTPCPTDLPVDEVAVGGSCPAPVLP